MKASSAEDAQEQGINGTFFELIDFADDEGIIGPKIAAKLACPCRKLELERIDGIARPKSAPKARGRLPGLGAALVRPCAETSEREPRCSIFGVFVNSCG